MSGEHITLKSLPDIEKMKAAGQVVGRTLEALEKAAGEGVSTQELNDLADETIRSCGATPTFLGYSGYPKSICTSVNSQVVHGIPGKYRLKDGDIVSCDVGACLEGFQGDAARTFLVGNVPEEVRDLVRVTRECFWEAAKQCYLGKRVSDIARAVQKHAESHGYGVVREMIGHGIGRDMHEPPDVPNYWDARLAAVYGHGTRLQQGMAIAIEPMINLGGRRIVQWDDGWTVEAEDGKPSAHYENTVIITGGEPIFTTLYGEEIQ